MKEGVGYTATLNIVIVFITIIFAFISAALIYFKSNKVSNVITETIEKYEGYNSLAINEIGKKLTSIGYNSMPIDCTNEGKYYKKIDADLIDGKTSNGECRTLTESTGNRGYCVFMCQEMFDGECYYYYKISTNLMINIPIVNDIVNFPIYSNTNRLYDFEDQVSCKKT